MSYASLYERIVAQTEVPEEQCESTGCWVWQGTKDAKGYGRVSVRRPGRNPTGVRVHRAVMEHVLGRELHPDDETVEHLCRRTACVNPDHLTLLSRSENTRKAAALRKMSHG